jgi:hypothetical protein
VSNKSSREAKKLAQKQSKKAPKSERFKVKKEEDMTSFQKLLITFLLVFLHCVVFVCSKDIDIKKTELTQTNVVKNDEMRKIEELWRQSADVTKKTVTKTHLYKEVDVTKATLTQTKHIQSDINTKKQTLAQTNFVVTEDMKEDFFEALVQTSEVNVDKNDFTKTNFIDTDYIKELKEAVKKYTPQKINLAKETLVQTDRLKGLSLMEPQIGEQTPMKAMAKGIVDLLKAYFVEPNLNFGISVYGELPNVTQEQLDRVYEAWHRNNTTDPLPLRTSRQEKVKDPDGAAPEYLIDSPALVFIDIENSTEFVQYATINFDFTTELRYLLFVEKQPEDKPIDETFVNGKIAPFTDIICKEGNKLSL